MAFDSIEPFGDPRADLRAGIVASTVANSVMGKGSKPTQPSDFMPILRSPAARGPVKLANPAEHGQLIAESLFRGLEIKKAKAH